jgi:hypothetical protein
VRIFARIALAATLLALAAPAAAKLSRDDVIKMVKAGLPETVVIATIKASDTVFELAAADIIALHKAGVSAKVIEAMVATAKAAKKAAAPAATPTAPTPTAPTPPAPTPPATSRQAEEDRRADEERRRRRARAEEERRAEDRGAADRRRAEEERRREDERRTADRRREEEARLYRLRAGEEARRREEVRKSEEERRLRDAEERRRRAEEQRLSEKFGAFEKAKNLAAAGKHLAAAGAFYEFLTRLATPDTQEYYDAEYLLGRELERAGVGHAAIPFLTSIVLRGPGDPNFIRAFRRLRVLGDQLLVTNPDAMEKISQMLVDRFSEDFRDEFHYTVGKFYNAWGNHTKAMRFLERVGERSEFFASAAYLRGLILMRDKKAKSAHEMFKKAVLAAEQMPGKRRIDRGVLELGYLALARLAYEVGGYDAAAFYYDKIPHGSTKLGTALFEKGWSYFQSGNYPMALGAFHGLHSPYFADRFHPDLYILESTIYLNMCHFTMAKELVEQYQKSYGKLHKDLKALLGRGTSPQDLFRMFLATGEGNRANGSLPIQLYSYVLQDAEFADLLAALKAYDNQLEAVRGALRAELRGEKLWREGLAAVEARRGRLYEKAGRMILQKLQKAEQELGELLIKADEITFETINAEKEQLDRETAALMTGKTLKEGKVKEAAKLEVPWTHEYWDYDGEVWADEVDAYRSLLADGCKQ